MLSCHSSLPRAPDRQKGTALPLVQPGDRFLTCRVIAPSLINTWGERPLRIQGREGTARAADGRGRSQLCVHWAAFGQHGVQPVLVKKHWDQRGEGVCPKSHSQSEEEPAWSLGLLTPGLGFFLSFVREPNPSVQAEAWGFGGQVGSAAVFPPTPLKGKTVPQCSLVGC